MSFASSSNREMAHRRIAAKQYNPDEGSVAAKADLKRNPASPTITMPGRTERSDEELLDAYRHGDVPSFEKLVVRYQRELYHFLVRFLGDRTAADDVFQETFLQIHQSAEQFDTSRRFRPWLFTISANKARDLMRSQARRPTHPLQASVDPSDEESGQYIDLLEAAGTSPSEPLERKELQEIVRQMVMSMPENLREILLLSYFQQFPYKQISEILDIPLGTVKSRLHAAVAYFADHWRHAHQSNPSEFAA